jgi:hypothetical protein
MGSILIVITLIGFFLQYRSQQISNYLHINQMFVYFILFSLLLVGVVIEIDSRK